MHEHLNLYRTKKGSKGLFDIYQTIIIIIVIIIITTILLYHNNIVSI